MTDFDDPYNPEHALTKVPAVGDIIGWVWANAPSPAEPFPQLLGLQVVDVTVDTLRPEAKTFVAAEWRPIKASSSIYPGMQQTFEVTDDA